MIRFQKVLQKKILLAGTSLIEIESDLVSEAVQQADGNLAEAARRLGITRRQLEYKFSKLNGN